MISRIHEEPGWVHLLRSVSRWLVLGMPVFLVMGSAAADIALSLVAIFFLVRSIAVQDWSWIQEPLVKVSLALWGWLFVATIFAFDRGASLGVALPWFRFFVFAAAVMYWVLDQRWLRRCVVFLGVVLVFVALDTLVQYFWGRDVFGFMPPSTSRMTGPLDKMVVGAYISKLMYLPLVAGLWWGRERYGTVGVIFFMLVLGLLATAVVLSGERMATIHVVIGLVVAVIAVRSIRKEMLFVGLVVLAMGSVLLLSFPSLVDRHIDQTARTLEEFPMSPYGQLWRSGLALGASRPLTGVGLKNFRLVCADDNLGISAENTQRCNTHPHNYYIEWFSESGVIGLVGFMVFVWVLIRTAWHGVQRGIWWLGGIVSLLVIQLWPFGSTGSFFYNWNGVMLWYPVGVAFYGLRSSVFSGSGAGR